MRGRKADLTGQAFARLTVLREAEPYVSPAGHRRLQWLCRCSCGAEVIVMGNNLTRGRVQSCGCYRSERQTEWGGDGIGYKAIHARVRFRRGPAKNFPCVDCEGSAIDWSYRGDCPDERTERVVESDLRFCHHVECYEPRCKSCHKRYDLHERGAQVATL